MFKAVISADLHFTVNRQAPDSIVPMIRECERAMTAFVSNVIRIHPDVLILLGDLTLGGRDRDTIPFAKHLERLRKAEIPMILLPGNHEFDQGTAETFRKLYFPYLTMETRDPASLSYTRSFGNLTFLCMDDSSTDHSGYLGEETMNWLQESLSAIRAKGNIPIFLSHHNVLRDEWIYRPDTYRITAVDLEKMLKEYRVPVIFSGHQHFPAVRSDSGLKEIVVPMPWMPRQRFGLFTIADNVLNYQLMPVAFPLVFEQVVREKNLMARKNRQEIFTSIFAKKQVPAEKYLPVINAWFDAYESGRLHESRAAIKAMPHYASMMLLMQDNPYGLWFGSLMKEEALDDCRATVIIS